MRKLTILGVLVAVLLAVFGGAILAQDDDTTETTDESAWLGIAIAENDEGQVIVTAVQSGSPADAADLLINDVIVSFDGEAVDSAAALVERVQAAAPGDEVSLEVLRDDETVSVAVTLGTAPTRLNRRGLIPGNGRNFDFEFTMPEFDISALEAFLVADLEEADGGYAVLDVFSLNNPFELQEGDVITAVNGIDVTELDMLSLVETFSEMDEPTVTLSVTRDGEEITLESDTLMHGLGFGLFRDGDGFNMPFRNEMPFGNFHFDNPGRGGFQFRFRAPFNNDDDTQNDDANTEGAATVPSLPADGQA